jgi:hypothetical protein
MSLGAKFSLSIMIGWSIIIGWAIACFLLIISFSIENQQLTAILLWNVKLFAALAGNGPLLGYDAQGNPMYEGTPILIFFALIGVLSSFVIYPIILFLILTLINKVKGRNFESEK